jgi:hypothetical protein
MFTHHLAKLSRHYCPLSSQPHCFSVWIEKAATALTWLKKSRTLTSWAGFRPSQPGGRTMHSHYYGKVAKIKAMSRNEDKVQKDIQGRPHDQRQGHSQEPEGIILIRHGDNSPSF